LKWVCRKIAKKKKTSECQKRAKEKTGTGRTVSKREGGKLPWGHKSYGELFTKVGNAGINRKCGERRAGRGGR